VASARTKFSVIRFLYGPNWYLLDVDVLLQFAANILGWRKGHVAHMCGLSAGNYSRSGVGLASSAD